MSFETLDKKELFKTAIEDFGVDVKPTDTKPKIIAELESAGVTWELYLQAHPPIQETTVEPVVAETEVGLEDVVTAPAPVRTREAEVDVSRVADRYLIKMTRDNHYFEFKGYKFTKENPFNIMPAATANLILSVEDGFEIAKPDDAEAFFAK